MVARNPDSQIQTEEAKKAVGHVGSGMRCIAVPAGNYMADALGPGEAKYAMAVQAQTWGHLAPKPRKVYHGYIVFTYTAWGEMLPIEADFKGLSSSPWFFDDLIEFISAQCIDGREATVWRFDGRYIKNRDATCAFDGALQQINLGGAA